MEIPKIGKDNQAIQEKEARKAQDVIREVTAVLARHEIKLACTIVEIEGVVYEIDHAFKEPVCIHRKLGLLEFSTQGLRARLDEQQRLGVRATLQESTGQR